MGHVRTENPICYSLHIIRVALIRNPFQLSRGVVFFAILTSSFRFNIARLRALRVTHLKNEVTIVTSTATYLMFRRLGFPYWEYVGFCIKYKVIKWHHVHIAK